jgi:hypothetical protein
LGEEFQGPEPAWLQAGGDRAAPPVSYGTAVVSEIGGQRQFELDFQYDYFDRYNWDKGKSVDIAGTTITDQFMGEFHRQRLAPGT